MHALALIRPVRWAVETVGVAALILGVMLAAPVSRPPALASIAYGTAAIDLSGLPVPSEFRARDGSALVYRLYPARNGATDRLAILIHGSSGSSANMNAVARALIEAGVAAVAIDARGHGGSGTRGDIGYIGQLDDDLADLVAELRPRFPDARLALVGHSSGGGFALRIAGEAEAKLFDRFVLLAPYLGYFAPTTRPAEGTARWADPDLPRIVALTLLGSAGIDCCQSLPAVGFATRPGASVTSRYSYRLLTNFGPPLAWRGPLAAAAAPIDVIIGERDELMAADRYADALAPFAANVHLTVLRGVDHMGVLREPAALAAIVAAVSQ